MRKAQKGKLLLQFRKTRNEGALNYPNLVGRSLSKEVTMRQLTHEITAVCRDLDKIIRKKEIWRELVRQFQIPHGSVDAIKNLRKADRGTQVSCWKRSKSRSPRAACRIRGKTSPATCFKYLEYGHLVRSYTSTHDRSDRWRRCGEKDHLAWNCEKNPEAQ